MNQQPVITIPRVQSPEDTTGLAFRKTNYGLGGLYYAHYFVNGVIKLKSLKTIDTAQARKARDAFYAGLLAKGATVSGLPGRKAKVKK